MMANEKYFSVSYSRRELYFAEYLVLQLQARGLNIFFDLQQLEPGEDWQRTLEHGFTNCEAVIVVVSKASMQSPYVQREYEGALERDIPVICVIFEPVALPQALANCPRYDFRSGFGGKIKQLTRFLQGDDAPRHDRVPMRYTPYRVKLQRPVAFTLFALLIVPIGGLLLLCGALYLYYSNIGIAPENTWQAVLLVVLLTVLPFMIWRTLYPARQFWQRDASFARVRMTLLRHTLYFVPIGIILIIALIAQTGGEYVPFLGYIVIGTFLYILLIMLLNMFGRFPILSWFGIEGGTSLQDIRLRKHSGLIKRITRSGIPRNIEAPIQEDDEGSSVVSRDMLKFGSFVLHYVAADAGYASHIRRRLRRQGLQEIEDEAATIDIPVLTIISNQTNGEAVQQWLDQYAHLRLIFVVISQFELPVDVKQQMQKFQYFDMRRGINNNFKTLAGYLKGDHISTSLNINPVSLDDHQQAKPVVWLRRTLVISILYLALHTYWMSLVVLEIDTIALSIAMVSLIVVVLFQVTSLFLVAGRRINQYIFRGTIVLACLALLAYASPLANLPDSTGGNSVLNIWRDNGNRLFAGFSFALYVPVLFFMLRNTYWLPR